MANVSLKFNCESGDGTTLECWFNPRNNEVCLAIDPPLYDESDIGKTIQLDKSTAIKLVKVLKTEINKIK